MNDPALKEKAWSVAFETVLRKGWLTSKQINYALEYGWKAANREAKS